MARILSATVLRRLPSATSATLRRHSTKVVVTVKLEEAVQKAVVKKSQPDWLALVPGASFWVPPANVARGLDKVVAGLVNRPTPPPNHEVTVDFSGGSTRCWPSSTLFFKGVTQSPLEGEPVSFKQSKASEEEEG